MTSNSPLLDVLEDDFVGNLVSAEFCHGLVTSTTHGAETAQPLTARAAAAAEGLELVPSSTNETGFKGVRKHYGKFIADVQTNGNRRRLGSFATAEEAALCRARHIGAKQASAETQKAKSKGDPLTADEARALAMAEGLELKKAPTAYSPDLKVLQKLRQQHNDN